MSHFILRRPMSAVPLVTLVLVLFCVSSSWARPWIYEPSDPQEAREFSRQMHDAYNRHGRFLEMRDAYLAEARTRQGTGRGGDLLLSAANITISRLNDFEVARVLFQEAIQLYPRSRIEVGARSNLASWERLDSAAMIAVMSQISVDLGGPSVEEVLAAPDGAPIAARVRSLHPEKQLGVWHVFQNIYWSLHQSDPDKAFQIARFGRSTLEQGALAGNSDFTRIFYSDLTDKHNPSGNVGTVAAPPRFGNLTPTPGATVAPNPTISLQATTGDYHSSPIDLTRIELEVDGVVHQFDVVVTSNLDLSFQEGQDFETLTLTLPTDLQPGQHSVTARIPRQRVNSDPQGEIAPVERTWSFIVADTPPPATTETLPASKDALVYERGPHANEGANPRLTLEKITGKVSRDLVGFDLANVDTSRLSKATLVLTIDSSQQVTGWGHGETVSVSPLTTPWQEGNGKKQGLPTGQQTAGSGAGTTWFSPVDENIANSFANSVVSWSGAATFQGQGSALPQTVGNHQTGELRFDVTGDVISGAQNGWLLRKDQESKGSKVSFYSKEGAAAAGAPDLGPRLILEYDSPSAQAEGPWSEWLSWLGWSTNRPRLQAKALDFEMSVVARR